MNGLKQWLRALRPGAQRAQADALSALRATVKTLRSELRAMDERVRGVSGQLDAVRVQLDQLAALREEEARSSGRVSPLTPLLDADRIRTHLREAVARAVRVEQPVAHALVADVLPHDVYAALLTAVPAPIFFAGGAAGGQEMPVPPRIAPADAIATWSVLAQLMRDAFVPALTDRFDGRPDVGFTIEMGRLVCREAGSMPVPSRVEPWHLFTVVIHLAVPHDSAEYGTRIGGTEVPFRPNTALVLLGQAAHEYVPIPADAGVTRCNYEFRISADKAGREALPR
jgi:hypothetical protein